jgi:uncharacterized membrane protein required for colicin V production
MGGAIARILGMAFGAATVDVIATAINPLLGIVVTIASIVWIINMVVDVIYKLSHLG